MRKNDFMKPIQFLAFLLLLVACSNTTNQSNQPIQIIENTTPINSFDSTRLTSILSQQIARIKRYNVQSKNKYSNSIAVFIDMHISSKYFRCFVVDLKTDSIVSRGLCAHGSGSEIPNTDSLQFSNTPNSYMSSLGIYQIGTKYTGNFGLSYKLYGLESSNNNAYKRVVVMHPYSCVPDEEQTYPICNSLGCPMLSDNYMKEMIKFVDQEPKPVLMVMYY